MLNSRIIELVRKEFIHLFRDKKIRPMLVILPLLQIMLFGYVVNFDVANINLAVWDGSRSKESRELINDIEASKIFRVVSYASTPRDLEAQLMTRHADIAINIPQDFSAKLAAGVSAPLQVLVDGTVSHIASVRVGYLSNIIQGYANRKMEKLYGGKLQYGKIDLRLRAWYNPNLESQIFFVPCVVAFVTMILSLLLTSMAIIREKEIGTMEQLIVTPIKKHEFILAKTIPYVLISLAVLLFSGAFGAYLFKLQIAGNILWILLGAVLFLICTTSIGLLISTTVATQQEAMMTTFLLLVPFVLLSGFVFPVENMPTVVQWLTYLDPLRFFIAIIRGVVLRGVGFEVLYPQFLGLFLLGTAALSFAVIRWRKTVD
ncbi:MAG: ABC transporter permease [Deltaproteobacteria bacterium]|nr:ABC transporter permease [Deltaproteobacteria bacterium]